jgi:hypothetical protein
MDGIIYFDGYAKEKNAIRSWNVKTGHEKFVAEGSSPSFAENVKGQMVYRNVHGNGVMIGEKNLRLDAPKMDDVRISPDGKLLAVVETGIGGVDIVVVFNLGGKEVARAEGFVQPVWHPQEKSLLLTEATVGDETVSHLFRWDMKAKPKLLKQAKYLTMASALSAKSTKDATTMLAYAEQNVNNTSTIMVCPLSEYAKGAPSVLLSAREKQTTMGLCFSPDGNYLTTWVQDKSQYTLVIIEINTRRRAPLKNPPRPANPFGILVWR